MAGIWRALVLVAALTIVACQDQRRRRLTYERIVNQALDLINQEQGRGPLFRLVTTIPPPNRRDTSTIPLNFRIKETVCLADDPRPLQQCPFRQGGEERDCTGNFIRRQNRRMLTVDCTGGNEFEDEDLDREGLRGPGQGPRKRRSSEPSKESPPDRTELPPSIRDIYEKAKYDIIFNILKNF